MLLGGYSLALAIWTFENTAYTSRAMNLQRFIETAYGIEKLALGFDEKAIIFISHNFLGKLIKEYDEILVASLIYSESPL